MVYSIKTCVFRYLTTSTCEIFKLHCFKYSIYIIYVYNSTNNMIFKPHMKLTVLIAKFHSFWKCVSRVPFTNHNNTYSVRLDLINKKNEYSQAHHFNVFQQFTLFSHLVYGQLFCPSAEIKLSVGKFKSVSVLTTRCVHCYKNLDPYFSQFILFTFIQTNKLSKLSVE